MTTLTADFAMIGCCEDLIINVKNKFVGVLRVTLCYVISPNPRELMTTCNKESAVTVLRKIVKYLFIQKSLIVSE
jgi:hypothetical protein